MAIAVSYHILSTIKDRIKVSFTEVIKDEKKGIKIQWYRNRNMPRHTKTSDGYVDMTNEDESDGSANSPDLVMESTKQEKGESTALPRKVDKKRPEELTALVAAGVNLLPLNYLSLWIVLNPLNYLSLWIVLSQHFYFIVSAYKVKCELPISITITTAYFGHIFSTPLIHTCEFI